MDKTITYEEFQKMVRLAPPDSGITAQSVAKSFEDKGYVLPQELSHLSTRQPREKTDAKQGFFSRLGASMSEAGDPLGKIAGGAIRAAEFTSPYMQAPIATMAGAFQKKVIAPVAGSLGMEGIQQSALSTPDVQNLSENLSKSADVARIGIPIAAGIMTGGASIPASMAITGAIGAGSSLLASGLEKLAGEEQSATGAAGEAVIVGSIDALLDGATRGLFKLAKPALKAVGKSDVAKTIQKVAGRILQTKDADEIAKGVKAIRSIDTKGIGTFEDMTNVVQNKLTALRTAQDEVLNAVDDIKPLSAFTVTSKAGKQVVKTNPVSSALDGLEELYAKTGAADDLVRIRQLKDVAKYRGLSAKEVNDIAREYGRGFTAFSDTTGQPLTSVNAKMYENVRKGVKTASRDMMPNEAAKQADDAMTSLITVKELSEDMTQKVQQLSNRIEDRGIFQKIASKIGGGIDLALGRTPSSFFTSLFVRGNIGSKQLNSLQIEQQLAKNLTKLDSLLARFDSMADDQIIGAMKEIIGEQVRKGVSATTQAGVGAFTNALQE